jgi:TATA-binding protein-associated factor Taf7
MENISLENIIRVDEIENNLILNVPESIGEKIHKLITEQKLEDKNNQNSKNSYNIEIIENPSESISDVNNSRKMIFNFNGELHPITILDLPCNIEAEKTIDYKNFYKGADICQMMYVHDDKLKQEEDLNNFNPFTSSCDKKFTKLLWTKDPDHKYKLKHGLGKATRNIRHRRFKRKLKYNKDEILEVAKKLKSIIDNGAANYDNKTNKTLETYENNDDNNTIQSGKMAKGFNNNNIKNDNKNNKKNKNKNYDNDINKSSNILSIPLDENDMFNDFEDNNKNITNKKKNKKNKNQKNASEGDNTGIIKIDFAPSVYEDSLEEKKYQMKKELQDKYKALKEEYVQIKDKLNMKEYANDKELHNKKKRIKKELRAMKEQYKNEMV